MAKRIQVQGPEIQQQTGLAPQASPVNTFNPIRMPEPVKRVITDFSGLSDSLKLYEEIQDKNDAANAKVLLANSPEVTEGGPEAITKAWRKLQAEGKVPA